MKCRVRKFSQKNFRDKQSFLPERLISLYPRRKSIIRHLATKLWTGSEEMIKESGSLFRKRDHKHF